MLVGPDRDIHAIFWREATINARLKEVMVKSFNDVLDLSRKHTVDMRTAAYMLAVSRVADATLTRGIPSTLGEAARDAALRSEDPIRCRMKI